MLVKRLSLQDFMAVTGIARREHDFVHAIDILQVQDCGLAEIDRG
jgi:hypothetical protein